jgi:hypothetical protein
VRRLIAVVTCHARRYPQHDQGGHPDGESRDYLIRDTWFKLWEEKYSGEIDLKFFYGWPPASGGYFPASVDKKHRVILDAPDDYYGLPEKVRKTYNWALRAGYDEITKVDDDVFLYVDRLLANPSSVDYRGFEIESDIKYASGTCYQLSRRAMEMVARAPIPEGEWREDRWTGRVLLDNGIPVVHDPRFLCCNCDVCRGKYKDSISIHTTHPRQLYELMET